MATLFYVQSAGSRGRSLLSGASATALLSTFTTSAAGLVPAASGGSTSTQFLRKDGTWAVPAGGGGGGGLSDGDYGDITVSGSGTAMAVDPGAITLAKMADLQNNRIIGNNAGATGVPMSLTVPQVNAMLEGTIAPVWGNITSKPADLTTIAGLSPSNDDFLQRKAGAWANRTVAQVKTDLGISYVSPLWSQLA